MGPFTPRKMNVRAKRIKEQEKKIKAKHFKDKRKFSLSLQLLLGVDGP